MMRRLLLTAALMPFAAQAQEPASTDVIVQANRFAVYRGDAAFSTLGLNADAIARADSLDRSLKLAGQATLFRRSSSLTANPTVQGLGLRAIAPSGAGRTLITVDGIPQNDPFGGWVIWASIPQDAVRHGHVVRGSGGGAYGAGALTGVVDLSLTPPQAQDFYSRAEATQGGSYSASLGGGIGDLSAHMSAMRMEGDAATRGAQRGNADRPTFGEDRTLLLNYQREVCAGVCGRLDLLAAGYDSRRDTGLDGATATSTGDTWSMSFTRQATADHNGFRVQLWQRNSDLANRSVSVGAGRATTTLANDQVATPASGTGLLAAIRHQTPELEWEIGLDARLNRGQSEEYYRYMAGAPTRFRVAGGETTLVGLYAEATRTFDRLSLTGAVRADSWQSHSGHRRETDLATGSAVLDLRPQGLDASVVTARLGATYRLDDALMLRGAAYNGFRPPSLNELYRPFRVGNDVTEANSALRPETLSGVEVGLRGSLWDIGLFHNVLKDPVTNVTVGFGPGTFPTAGFIPAGGSLRERRNGEAITAWGLEARGDWPVSERITLNASGTVTHARTADGLRPAQAPDYSASLGVTADLAKVSVTADLAFEGAAFEDDLNRLRLDAYQRLDLRADYVVTQSLTFTGRISNALDTAIPISRTGDGIISYDTGRRLWIGLVYRP